MNPLLIVAGAFLLGLLFIALQQRAVRMQREAGLAQDANESKIDECLALSREAARRQEENLVVVKALLELQRETNRLLALLTKGRSTGE